jgi:hypothetical protein
VSDDLPRPSTAGPVPPATATAEPAQEQPALQQAQAKVADTASTAQAKASDLQATAQAKVASAQAAASERPEVQAGLAFAGGFVAAMILKRLTR